MPPPTPLRRHPLTCPPSPYSLPLLIYLRHTSTSCTHLSPRSPSHTSTQPPTPRHTPTTRSPRRPGRRSAPHLRLPHQPLRYAHRHRRPPQPRPRRPPGTQLLVPLGSARTQKSPSYHSFINSARSRRPHQKRRLGCSVRSRLRLPRIPRSRRRISPRLDTTHRLPPRRPRPSPAAEPRVCPRS
ncbi:rh2 [macacine betaherpesvirus 3]|uniref:Rh2 n=1 Tax=Rhesus cytomegalovirus (strain 68-1) TaxID=47929 RepID=Q2FAX4_RHCM6|nr:rh2 [macacine betaherpesvirus 3]